MFEARTGRAWGSAVAAKSRARVGGRGGVVEADDPGCADVVAADVVSNVVTVIFC